MSEVINSYFFLACVTARCWARVCAAVAAPSAELPWAACVAVSEVFGLLLGVIEDVASCWESEGRSGAAKLGVKSLFIVCRTHLYSNVCKETNGEAKLT